MGAVVLHMPNFLAAEATILGAKTSDVGRSQSRHAILTAPTTITGTITLSESHGLLLSRVTTRPDGVQTLVQQQVR